MSETSPPGPTPVYAFEMREQIRVDEVLQHHEGLTFPPVGRRLAVRPARGPWAGVSAVGSEGTVGLGLLELRGDGPAQVVSLCVRPAHRARGLGRALLTGLERLAETSGTTALEGAYRTSWRSRPAIEALLRSRGWDPPQTRMLLARGETRFARSILRRPEPALPGEAEIFSWEDLEPVEREAIESRQDEDRWYPEILTPFQEEPRLEPTISVGLRWDREVAGWMICHRVAFDTLQYSAFFLREDLRGRGLGWALIREAVRRRLADPDLRYAIFAIDARNLHMRELIERRCREYFARLSELRVSRKELGSPSIGPA